MILAHNLTALNTERQLKLNQRRTEKSSFKLASGYRINKAADDAAGLSISEKMRAQIRGLNRASINAQEGVNLIQTAEGAVNEVHSILQRMSELSVQAANDTNTESDRQNIQDEIELLQFEIDRIAETTEFNTLKLLDGRYADPNVTSRNQSLLSLSGTNKGKQISLQEISNYDGMKLVYEELTHDVDTIQSASGTATMPGYHSLKNDLKTEIVPQAVQGIVKKYSSTFGYLKGSSIGIGLELYNNSSSSVLASVTLGVSGQLNALNVGYTLSVNLASLSFDGAGNLTAASRDELEITIIHEMTHALMDETLTNGMLGHVGNGQFQAGERFPSWFTEGMAQASAGGCFDGNDWVQNALGINVSTDTASIQNSLNAAKNRLGSATSTSEYGTGYLACMYLGYLASGGGAVQPSRIASGLDKILNEIKGGASLSQAIQKFTGYNGLSDFEAKFGTDGASFVHNLVAAVGGGTGGLVSGFTMASGFLPDKGVANPSDAKLFEVNITNTKVNNVYPAGYDVLTGGTRSGAGTPGPKGGNGNLNIQIGANANQLLEIHIESLTTSGIGVDFVNVTTSQGAQDAIAATHLAIELVSEQRARLGAYQNRLEHAIANLDNASENLQAAESRIRDLDMADEMVTYSVSQMLMQSGQAMLAQANQINDGVLNLLR